MPPKDPQELADAMLGSQPYSANNHAAAELLVAQASEIDRLSALVLIGDVRCEQCAAPATTLDMGEFASCADCLNSTERD